MLAATFCLFFDACRVLLQRQPLTAHRSSRALHIHAPCGGNFKLLDVLNSKHGFKRSTCMYALNLSLLHHHTGMICEEPRRA